MSFLFYTCDILFLETPVVSEGLLEEKREMPPFLHSFNKCLLNTCGNAHRFLSAQYLSGNGRSPSISSWGSREADSSYFQPPLRGHPLPSNYFRNGYLTQTKLMRAPPPTPPHPRALLGQLDGDNLLFLGSAV